jgi:hypothetical protein
MNHILYNISILILGFGIILMTVYITKATTKNNQIINLNGLSNRRHQSGITETGEIYDSRPSKTYSKMFSQPSLWLGYQEFDANENTEKIYVK